MAISIHTTTQVVTLRDILGIMRPIKFQSTPPRRWWLIPGIILGQPAWFQSTPPRRWWPRPASHTAAGSRFQSTPPRRWWRLQDLKYDDRITFQSTPPRRWWPGGTEHLSTILGISIHTTTQVVTCILYDCLGIFLFQSTPPRRWWPGLFTAERIPSVFQSTPPRRWWPYVHRGPNQVCSNFNPHHHAGGDETSNDFRIGIKWFQSTPPRRWWHIFYFE